MCCAQVLSHVQLFTTPWTIALQALCPRILEWVAISFSRDLPDPGIKPMSPELASGFFTTGIPDWEAPVYEITPVNKNKDVLIRKFIAM